MALESEQDLLLDAAISHLESLKRQGIRFIEVNQTLLHELQTPQPVVRRSFANSAPVSAPIPIPDSDSPPVSPSPAIAVRAVRSAVRTATPSAPLPADQNLRNLTPDQKEQAFAALQERASKCVLCTHLAATRRNVVFGVGNIRSRLMFVGEAPGAEEDVQGEPFVGAAGQLLTKIIQAMGLTRSEVYIGNVLKCRPDTPGQSYGNRKPTPEEMATCLPYLREQIAIIQPTVIVALGATAMEGLFGKAPVYITKLRGKWQDFQGIAVMPTYHPSYVLRNQSPVTKREIWEDMLAAMERLNMPISEKQRGYFLKG